MSTVQYPRVSIAPMMDHTDRHFRYLARLIAPDILLYSEMITSAALVRGQRRDLLAFSGIEHPVALQLGGSDPHELATAASYAERQGYDEVNLNVGCPSDRVRAGHFGACLMKVPSLVAECVAHMRASVRIPVTVKTRLGVDDLDSFSFLLDFVDEVAAAGCEVFIVHARKAWLKGLSPRQNREIPPLCYDTVYRLKAMRPHLTIGLNGGITTAEQARAHLSQVDSVMIGRAAVTDLGLMRQLSAQFAPVDVLQWTTVLDHYLAYMELMQEQGHRLKTLIKPLMSLFHGIQGARQWRRCLTEQSNGKYRLGQIIDSALQYVEID